MRKKYSSIIGPGAVILSAVLFGTMPLMAKRAFALGSNAYTTAFGRFATGAVIAGLVILLALPAKKHVYKNRSQNNNFGEFSDKFACAILQTTKAANSQ